MHNVPMRNLLQDEMKHAVVNGWTKGIDILTRGRCIHDVGSGRGIRDGRILQRMR